MNGPKPPPAAGARLLLRLLACLVATCVVVILAQWLECEVAAGTFAGLTVFRTALDIAVGWALLVILTAAVTACLLFANDWSKR